ncbi:MAG TPA: hypothetical protein VJJ78_03515 [Candidatus Saccharimonadales bacterium]|nr:hypothetical protein [Candidatus Saccharimonadales bacterium]
MKNLESRVAAIEARNAKVEQDKDWETSWTRRISIGLLTYAVIVIYLIVINNDKPFINAAVPAVGFLLSTLVLRQVRNIWQNRK